METLGGQDVHVWFAAPDRMLPDSCAVAHCLALLDVNEAKRYRAFRFDRDRHCFLAAHALLRMALSRYAPIDTSEWVFDTNEHGRPAIAGPSGAFRFKFSLSHTDGMVACAICQHAEVGVDVETVSPDTPALELAKRYFAATEYDMLRHTPDHDLSGRFFAIWTLKEAYIKARGMGLSLPLDGFAFEFTAPETPGIRFAKTLTIRLNPGDLF